MFVNRLGERWKPQGKGFTLAELLIALAILGVIAVFTIPKVLQAQQNQAHNAIAKEAMSIVSGAYHQYRLQNGPSTAVGVQDLTPYMNYVRLDGTGRTFDSIQGEATVSCNYATGACLFLHNGGLIKYFSADTFGGSSTTNCIWFMVDPDGKVTDGTTNGPGKSVWFALFYNERVATYQTLPPGGATSDTIARTACTDCDPPWFSW